MFWAKPITPPAPNNPLLSTHYNFHHYVKRCCYFYKEPTEDWSVEMLHDKDIEDLVVKILGNLMDQIRSDQLIYIALEMPQDYAEGLENVFCKNNEDDIMMVL